MPRPLSLLVALALLLAGCGPSSGTQQVSGGPLDPNSGLPLPSSVSRTEYQEQLYAFLGSMTYRDMGWRHDKWIRDTGPYRDGKYYGTHPAVKVYYSPEVLQWLVSGRQGEVPDGAMIIKEMYPPPAARYVGPPPDPQEWTVMVRDKEASVDGWFWAYYGVGVQPDNDDFPFNYPNSDFGSYCVRCHTSAENQLTFITEENIEGFPGEPIQYDVDDSWKTDADGPGTLPHPREVRTDYLSQEWLDLFNQMGPVPEDQVQKLPPETEDRVWATRHTQFVTSDQCMSCHFGDRTNFGPNMVVDNEFDVSPYGEWRWTMMGLAGRDPIFYAQLESEVALHVTPGGAFPTPEDLENVCLRCHGVMGQRQFTHDNPDELFSVAKAMAHTTYGGLARDGISCMACHRIENTAGIPLQQIQTGNFPVAPPDANGNVTLYGPYANPLERPMQEALAVNPVLGEHMKDSRLCASCHTVFLPVLDQGGQVIDQKYEQATYLEWQNSQFRDGSPNVQSCQDCHMPDTFAGQPLTFKLASIQDQDFPLTAFLASLADITVQPRPGIRRHVFVGANVFGLSFFRQFPDILGVRLNDYMSGLSNGLDRSIQKTVEMVQERSGSVQVVSSARAGDQATVRLRVRNLAGHRFPSGVGFRRLFLEVVFLDAQGQVVWGSGRTNSLGVIVGPDGQPLPSEFHEGTPQAFQPHYQVVDAQTKVQIYEELEQDASGRFSTSFLSRVTEVKDNRLLPVGWTTNGPPGFEPEFAEATRPVGDAATDPDFTNGQGEDVLDYVAALPPGTGPVTVRATLWSQSIPPGYLNERFSTADGPATQRLYYLGSHLDPSKTPFPEWKLRIAGAEAAVP